MNDSSKEFNIEDIDNEEKLPGIHSAKDMEMAEKNANAEFAFSRKLEVFQPVKIRLLVDLSEIEPELKEYDDDGNLEKDSVCQIILDPSGTISIGIFNEQGNGTSYLEINNPKQFKEGVHFAFE